jgi:alpha-L-rhamnosidase
MYGNVSSDWQISSDKFMLSVEVPANTRATIRLPNATLNDVTESNRIILTDKTLVAKQDSNAVVVEVGSGRYVFAYPWTSRPTVQ